MRTIKTKLFVALLGVLTPMLTINCSEKKNAEKAETAEATAKGESLIKVATPPYQKFVVVTKEEAGLYKNADTNSPTMVRWYDADCESDLCENFCQWSDQPGKEGFDLSTETIAYEGRVYPVLGEEGDFYKVSTIDRWCEIESAYIPKSYAGDIECAPIKADLLEADDSYIKCRVMKEGKYKNIVLIDEYDELNGETLHVGVLLNGVVATPFVYDIDSQMIPELEGATDNIEIEENEGYFQLRYNKSLSMVAEEGYEAYQLDLKKLSDEQIAKIVDTVIKKKPEYVNYMYHFPAMGLESFIYKAK